MGRIRTIALALALLGATVVAGVGWAAHEDVSFVRIIRATQQPYQPVAFRIWIKAPVGERVFVGVKIFDEAGNGVYAGKPSQTNYTQPYYSTSLTLKWNKIAFDGSRLPRGQRFRAIAFASSLGTNQRLFRSSPYSFTLTT